MNIDIFIYPSLYIFESQHGGYGVFTYSFIPANTLIEIAHCIPISQDEREGLKTMLRYDYTHDDDISYVALGFGSIYNHSDDYNVDWVTQDDNKIVYTTNRDVHQNEELLISYGENYFEMHGIDKL